MAKRINVVLQDDTAKTIMRAAKSGERSHFIDRAVRYYAAMHSTEAIRSRLKQAAIRDRDLAAEIARDWSAVDHEAWQTPERGAQQVKHSTRNGGKSGSSRSTRA